MIVGLPIIQAISSCVPANDLVFALMIDGVVMSPVSMLIRRMATAWDEVADAYHDEARLCSCAPQLTPFPSLLPPINS